MLTVKKVDFCVNRGAYFNNRWMVILFVHSLMNLRSSGDRYKMKDNRCVIGHRDTFYLLIFTFETLKVLDSFRFINLDFFKYNEWKRVTAVALIFYLINVFQKDKFDNLLLLLRKWLSWTDIFLSDNTLQPIVYVAIYIL